MNNLTIVSNERVSINKNQEFKSTNLDLHVQRRRDWPPALAHYQKTPD